MATPVSFPRNLDNVYRVQIADGAGATTFFFPLNPNKTTSIHVKKNGMSATVSFTLDTTQKSTTYPTSPRGAALTDLEDANIIFSDQSTGTADYFAGNNHSLTGIKIVSTPVGADVEISIVQNSFT